MLVAELVSTAVRNTKARKATAAATGGVDPNAVRTQPVPGAAGNTVAQNNVSDLIKRLTAYIPVEIVSAFTFVHGAICASSFRKDLQAHWAAYLVGAVLAVFYVQAMRYIELKNNGIPPALFKDAIERRMIGATLLTLK